jgi:hypothetical protein
LSHHLRIDDHDVRLRIIVLKGRPKIDPSLLISSEHRSMGFQRNPKKKLKVARDLMMRVARRGHHHGDTIDQFPTFFTWSPFQETPKEFDRETRAITDWGAGHSFLTLSRLASPLGL